jgi:hypothetical protein
VNISGTVRATDLKFSQEKDVGLLHMHMGLWVYCSATTTMVAEIGTKQISQEPSEQLIRIFRNVNDMGLSL